MKSASIKVGNRRLLKLAAFLEKLPRRRFDYSTFVGEGWRGAEDLSCGTTACAIGWATTIPEFRRLGLRLDVAGMEPIGPGRGEFGCAAGNTIFAIDDYDGDFLFGAWGHPQHEWAAPKIDATAKQVARHIRKFVAKRGGA